MIEPGTMDERRPLHEATAAEYLDPTHPVQGAMF